MANKKIEHIQFRRNKTVYPNLNALIKAIKEPTFIASFSPDIRDGEIVLLRYTGEDNLVNTLLAEVYVKPSGEKELHIECTSEDIKDIILKLIQDNSSNGTGIESDGTTLKIKISSQDKVLSLNKDGLSANVSLKYIPTEAKVQLLGKDNTVISEVDFPFESMVKASELTKDNKLKLTFNTTKGDQVIEVNLAKLVDVYTAGDSIAITGKKVSVKVDSTASKGELPIVNTTNGLKVDDSKFKSLTERVTKVEKGQIDLPETIDLGYF